MASLDLKDPSLFREACYINGQWVGAGSNETIDVTNPATGEMLGTIPKMGADETRQAIEAANDAYPAWRAKTAKERAAILRNWFDLMMENQEDLAKMMTAEQGKPLKESMGEIVYAASFIEWFAEEGKRIYGDTIPQHAPGKRIVVTKEPIGVCAAITPWNFPAAMITRKCGPALAAGCTMVVKPATATPYSALALAELGVEVELAGGSLAQSATGCSYGGVPWWAGAANPLGELLATAPRCWDQLQQRHGDLGLRPAQLWLHWSEQAPQPAVAKVQQALAGLPQQPQLTPLSAQEAIEREPLLAGADLGGVLQLPYWRVDPLGFQQGLERAWTAAGVQRSAPLAADELRQRLEQGDSVVLCSGAATLALLKAMALQPPSALAFSWAGVARCDGAQLAAERIVMPLLGQRSARETAASGGSVICDPGLAPAPGGGVLLGQTSWFDRSIDGPPPAADDLKQLSGVRSRLAPSLSESTHGPLRLQQQPVAYSRDQQPLLGPLLGCSNLSLFTGFGGPFALVPAVTPLMAQALVTNDWTQLKSLGLLCR